MSNTPIDAHSQCINSCCAPPHVQRGWSQENTAGPTGQCRKNQSKMNFQNLEYMREPDAELHPRAFQAITTRPAGHHFTGQLVGQSPHVPKGRGFPKGAPFRQ